VVSNLYGTFPKSVVVQVMCKMTCKKYYVDISTSAVYQTRWTNCLYWFFPPSEASVGLHYIKYFEKRW